MLLSLFACNAILREENALLEEQLANLQTVDRENAYLKDQKLKTEDLLARYVQKYKGIQSQNEILQKQCESSLAKCVCEASTLKICELQSKIKELEQITKTTQTLPLRLDFEERKTFAAKITALQSQIHSKDIRIAKLTNDCRFSKNALAVKQNDLLQCKEILNEQSKKIDELEDRIKVLTDNGVVDDNFRKRARTLTIDGNECQNDLSAIVAAEKEEKYAIFPDADNGINKNLLAVPNKYRVRAHTDTCALQETKFKVQNNLYQTIDYLTKWIQEMECQSAQYSPNPIVIN